MMLLNDYRRMTRAEVGILVYVLLVTFRVCAMPAILSEGAGESCFYVVMAGLGIDGLLTLLCLRVAAMGGLPAVAWPKPVKRILFGLLALLFLFKTTLRVYEVTDYCVNELFDHATPLLLAVVLIVTSALLATKGFVGVARTGLMYAILVAFLAVLSVFYVEFGGYDYNLFALLRPQGVGNGLLRSLVWMGDGLVFLLVDLRSADGVEKRYTWGVLSLLVVIIGMAAFYLNFVYTYGSAGQYVRYAFVRMLTNGDPDALGALDWPVLLIWLSAVPLHLAALFYAAMQSLHLSLTPDKPSVGVLYYTGSAVAVTVAYSLLFGDKDGFMRLIESRAVSYALIAACGLIAIAAVAAVATDRKRRKAV